MDQPLEQDHGTRETYRAQGRIELRHVTFYLSDQRATVLKDVSLVIELVKPWRWSAAGSGKSTIASLLTRFYDISVGKSCLMGSTFVIIASWLWRRPVAHEPERASVQRYRCQ